MNISEKNKQILIVSGILGAAILVIVVYLGFMFVFPQVNQFNQDRIKAEGELRVASEKLNRYKAYLEDDETRAKVEEAFGRVNRRLPRISNPVEVFDVLRDYIEGTDVAFTFLEPGRQRPRERYIEYPFNLRGSARYHQFGQLLNLIECNPDRLMRVTAFKLTNNNRRPSIHPMELSLETYTFRDR